MMDDLKTQKSEQRRFNRVTLKVLKQNRSSLSKAHVITNVFYVFRKEDVERLIGALAESGYNAQGDPVESTAKSAEQWIVEAQASLVPKLAQVDCMTDECVEIAALHGGEYDGWYTEVIE